LEGGKGENQEGGKKAGYIGVSEKRGRRKKGGLTFESHNSLSLVQRCHGCQLFRKLGERSTLRLLMTDELDDG
jgi:hypothetical protein